MNDTEHLDKWQETLDTASHLGDGVYALFDGHGIWLHANHHLAPTDRIYLEPEVFEALIKYRDLVVAGRRK